VTAVVPNDEQSPEHGALCKPVQRPDKRVVDGERRKRQGSHHADIKRQVGERLQRRALKALLRDGFAQILQGKRRRIRQLATSLSWTTKVCREGECERECECERERERRSSGQGSIRPSSAARRGDNGDVDLEPPRLLFALPIRWPQNCHGPNPGNTPIQTYLVHGPVSKFHRRGHVDPVGPNDGRHARRILERIAGRPPRADRHGADARTRTKRVHTESKNQRIKFLIQLTRMRGTRPSFSSIPAELTSPQLSTATFFFRTTLAFPSAFPFTFPLVNPCSTNARITRWSSARFSSRL